jgi:hypothetical protein
MNHLYPDFNYEKYRDLNPYLLFQNLKTKEDYEKNYMEEGRYKGRIYKEDMKENKSFHLLLPTIGKATIFKMLFSLKNQLLETDYLTIVYDGSKNTSTLDDVKKATEQFKCKVNIIVENDNLGFWGHAIRNKHNNLEGDFIFHIDDDDILLDNAMNTIRKICKDTRMIYIFKIILENNKIVWRKKSIIHAEISTQSGIIPMNINKTGFWELKYGGDFDFYKNLSKKNHVLFIDKLIYQKF